MKEGFLEEEDSELCLESEVFPQANKRRKAFQVECTA